MKDMELVGIVYLLCPVTEERLPHWEAGPRIRQDCRETSHLYLVFPKSCRQYLALLKGDIRERPRINILCMDFQRPVIL